MTEDLFHPGKNVCQALDKAYFAWKSESPLDGKKFIYFEHHCDVNYGCTFVYDYTTRKFYSWRVTDEKKYMLFLLKYQ